MKPLTLGIIREGKVPSDKRVPFTPQQVEEIIDLFPNIKVVCQASSARCYTDDEYRAVGIEVREDMNGCDLLMGIKEVPITQLIDNKTYLFFSHTIKKQPYNKKLLQEILQKKIRLIDYEALKDPLGNRLVAFGRFAGIVGAYNALWVYGKRYHKYSLRRAFECFDVNDLKLELRNVSLPSIKIILTGGGRVGKGAMETLDTAGIRKVSPHDFLTKQYSEPVYVQLTSADYHTRKDGGRFIREEFHQHPEYYDSDFMRYAHVADLLIAGAFWNPHAPILFTRKDMTSSKFKIKIIADITCDIDGSIPSTKKATTIANPLYDYNPETDTIHPALNNEQFITVMSIDNLPCELPRSASEEFGRDLIDKILKPLIVQDENDIIERATITQNGELTSAFSYLQDYVKS